jgi:hypothetical protein
MSRYKPALLFIFSMAWASASNVAALGTTPLDTLALEAKNHAPYPDSAQGLKQELKDMRELARTGKTDELRAMIADLEIPDAQTWYLANFGKSGLETANSYKENLLASEERFKNQMSVFAREDGYFSVKKQDARKVYPVPVTAPEVFLAAWGSNSVSGEHPDETPFGYFFFIDGKFRWDSTIAWVTVDSTSVK